MCAGDPTFGAVRLEAGGRPRLGPPPRPARTRPVEAGAAGTGMPAACAGVPVLDDAMRQKPLPAALRRSVDAVAAAMRRWASGLVPRECSAS